VSRGVSVRVLAQCLCCVILSSRLESSTSVPVEYRVGDRSIFTMIDVEFTSDELALVHHALSAFLSDFGHKQADVVHQLRDLMGKIPTPA
jgi:hypothetical protein